MILPCSFPSLL